MRKDVKIGLAVGGIIFVVVLSYALFFTGKDKNKPNAEAQATRPASVEKTHVGTEDTSAGANAPSPSRDEGVVVVGPGTPSYGAASPATPPSTPPAPPSRLPGNPWDDPAPPSPTATAPQASWEDLLDRGGAPLSRTETPGSMTPPAAPTTPPSAPPAAEIASAPPELAPSTPSDSSTPATPPTTPPSGNRTHVVKQGETYWSIAESEYGAGSLMNLIIKANPKYPPNKLRPNVTLIIPPKESAAAGTGTVASTRTPTPAPTTRPFDPLLQYRVKPGDSLYSISKALYGRVDRVEKLYDLNKEQIGPNPRNLKLNMILTLPEPPSKTISAELEAVSVPN